MMSANLLLLQLLGSIVTHGHGASTVDATKGGKCNGQEINVLNFVSSDSEIGTFWQSLDDVPSLAILENDLRGALPKSFTICSDIMSVFSTVPARLMFFNLLGRDGNQILPALMADIRFFTTKVASGQIPTVFPYQWVRSCMAIDSSTGMIQWVVNGNLVENSTIDILQGDKIPPNLSGNVILGAYQTSSTKSWMVFSNKLTNLNIFYGLLPLAVMQKRTKGDETCLEEGDYLAWSKMKWDLRGAAVTDKIKPEDLQTNPKVNLYKADFPSRDTCKHFCENIGSQMPTVSNNDALEKLQSFCDKKMKKLTDRIWLPIDDIEDEGVWRDMYTAESLNYTPPWVGNEPNGGTKENCAVVVACNWLDMPCEDASACLCENQPRPIIKLLGLCRESVIDRKYQPQNDVKDIERLSFVGHSSSIEHDRKLNLWMINVVNYNVTGTSKASKLSFTLGKHTWSIVGDTGCNEDERNSYKVDLKM